jgi:hypothetical protein
MEKFTFGLYRDEVLDPSLVSELNRLAEVAKFNHPTLNFSWMVQHTTQGRATVKIQILGIETHFLICDALAAFRRLAG